MDHSDLPQSSQDRIAAAEIEADSILTNSRGTANAFAAEASRMGVDPSGVGFSPGDIPLELARKELVDGRDRATGYLFGAIADEYLKRGKLDIPGFDAKLEGIAAWAFQRFRSDRSVLDQLKQYCRAAARRMRAQEAESTPVPTRAVVQKQSTPEIPSNTDINAWAERSSLSGEYLPRIATASGANRQELICELAAKLFASWARRRVNFVGSLDDIPTLDKEQGTYLSLIVLPHLSGVSLDDQDISAIDVTIAGCRRTWLARAIERTQDDPERPASLSTSAWSRAKALDSSFKTQVNQGTNRDRVVCEHLQRCFDALAEDHIDAGLVLDFGTLHQTFPQASHAVAVKFGWLPSEVEWQLTIVQEWLTKLFEGRIAYFEACEIGRRFGHQHQKPDFVVNPVPETDPLMQTVMVHESLKKLNATEPFVVHEGVVRMGVEARGIPRDSPEFDQQFTIACADLAARHGGVCRVIPTIQPHSDQGEAEAKPEFRPREWSELQITFLSDDRIEIRIGPRSETRNCAEFGFASKKNGSPLAAWEFLRAMAKMKGIVQIAADSRKWGETEKRIQEIRKALRSHFGIKDDPIPYRKKVRQNPADFGYRTKFRLGCHAAYET